MKIEIPGYRELNITSLLLDYNGTSSGIDVELLGKAFFIDHVLEYKLGHGAAADVAVEEFLEILCHD